MQSFTRNLRSRHTIRLNQSCTIPTRRTLTSTARLQLKEDADRSPEELDKAKHEQINEQKRGEGRWREDLASGGETSVKADREASQVDDHGEHMKELQKQTAGETEKQKPEGKAQ